MTIHIHKKGDNDYSANFRPITLQSVPLKIFTACLRSRIFEFLQKNKLIEHNVQKGFTPKISGTFEHASQMAHILNKAHTKQRSLVITLHHNLITEVNRYHHVPEHVQNLVKSLYYEFSTALFTSNFSTPCSRVGLARRLFITITVQHVLQNIYTVYFCRNFSKPRFQTQFKY